MQWRINRYGSSYSRSFVCRTEYRPGRKDSVGEDTMGLLDIHTKGPKLRSDWFVPDVIVRFPRPKGYAGAHPCGLTIGMMSQT